MKFISVTLTAAWMLSSLLLSTQGVQAAAEGSSGDKPNFVFIFTDDQDSQLDSLDYMPNLQKHLVKEGTLYENHYATIAVCCPSRVGLLRGQYAHNTNITDVGAPYGGYDRFVELGLHKDYLPLWLQRAGYSTHYIGKLMNQYNVNNYDSPAPPGFDYQEQLVDPYTYIYDTAVFSRNGEAPVYYNNTYQTDVIHTKGLEALRGQRNETKPFFLWLAPTAPHGQFVINKGSGGTRTYPPVPAARHSHLFPNATIPRHPHFNPKKQTKTASYWKTFARLNETTVDYLDDVYRKRLQALQAVDEMIPEIIAELKAQGKLDNTYIIYSADNGFHLGQHRALPGKCTELEEDINVPFIVRGPGVRKNHVSSLVSAHHDLAPTFLALAKGDEHVPDWVDGGVIPLTTELQKHPRPVGKESFSVEFWSDSALIEYVQTATKAGPNTYKTIRVIADEYNYKYTVWCTGEHELYDIKQDPYATKNIYNEASSRLVKRLDALLSVLKACRAHTCRDPWRVIHPEDTSVTTLKDALNKKYDRLYKRFEDFKFHECLNHYSIENEAHPFDHINLDANTSSSSIPVESTGNQQHNKRSTFQQSKPTSDQVVDLFNLVPRSTTPLGDRVPSAEELETRKNPVAPELKETQVEWEKYGFYNQFGN
ncbi:hypothetical protein LRAMOSA05928 [Lichtheimia ramosa]|uniref:Arylsulfatase n=1 Tax=Lichtheimia ramosa TaxID=688394 RepID=A0A077X2N7_9FUNG|nr:hypothetical protein LRAMOSA05928 [Lichtheimia ramosa]